MITGRIFPPELETNKDIYVYRKYLQDKALEPKSEYSSLIAPTIALGALGGLIGKKAINRPLLGAAYGASIPMILGTALKQYDDVQIDRAKALQFLPDDELDTYLDGKIERIRETNSNWKTKPVFDIKNALGKTASLKSKALKVGAKVLGAGAVAAAGTGLLVAGSVGISKSMNEKRWEGHDPEEMWANRPIVPPKNI